MRQKYYLLCHMIKQKWLAIILSTLLCLLPIEIALDFQVPILRLSSDGFTHRAVSPHLETTLIEFVDFSIPLGITPVQATGGLTMTKVVDRPVVVQGGLLTYTLTVTNNTGVDLTNVLITDTVPANTTCQDIGNPSPWLVDPSACTAGLASWLIPPIPLPQMVLRDGASTSLTYTVRVDEPLPDQLEIVNSAGSYGISAYELGTPSNTFTDLGLVDVSTTVNAPVWQIQKRAVPTPTVISGGLLTYTISLTNVGSAPTRGSYTVTDVVPMHTALSDNPDTGILSGGMMTWPMSQPLASGQGTQLSFTVQVTDPLTNNTAIVNDTYAVSGGNVLVPGIGIPITTTAIGKPVLTVSSVDSQDPVLAGDQLTYTITITNNGTITATNVTVTDTLDALTSFVTASPMPSTNSPPSYTFNLGSLAPGASDTIAITTTVSALAPHEQILFNDMVVTATDATSAYGTETTTVNAASFTLMKRAMSPRLIQAGELLTYTIHYANNSPIPATNIRITDTMPVSITDIVTPLSIDAPGATVVNGVLPTLVFTRANLVSETGVITIVGQVITSPWTATPQNITNQVSATFTGNPTVYSDTVTLAGEPAAPAKATYAVSPNPAVIDTSVSITATLTDQYNNPVANGTVISFTTTLGSIDDVIAMNGQAIGILNSSTPGVATVQVGNPGVAGPGIAITYTAAALAIEKTVNTAFASLGEGLIYTITVTNTGDTTATQVIVTDHLPLGISTVGTNPAITGGSAQSPTFALPDIPPLMSETLYITASVDFEVSDKSQLVNEADVTSTETTTFPSSTVTTTVQAPNFSLTKSVVPHSVVAGDSITYTITYTSDGSLPVAGLRITDTLPLSLTNLRVTSDAVSIAEESAIFPTLIFSKNTSFMGTETITVSGQVATTPWSSTPMTLTNFVTATVEALPGRTFLDEASLQGSSGPPFTITLVATPIITDYTGYSVIEAQTTDQYGNPITDGQQVSFSSNLAGSAFSAPNPVISSNGFASATLTSTVGGEATINVQVADIIETTVVTFAAPALTISKTSDRDHVPPSGMVVYTIVLTNTGNTPLTNLTLTDLLLNGELQFVSASPVPASSDGSVSVFNLPTLNPGLSQTVVLTATVSPNAAIGLSLENLASVAATELQNSVQDNAFTQVDVAALDLSTTIDPVNVMAGETLTYTIIYTNNQAIPITNIRLTDQLPSRLFDLVIDPGGATVVDNTPPILVFSQALLLPAASNRITITGQVITTPWLSTGLELTNVITATSDQDPFGETAQVTSQGQASVPASIAVSASTTSPTIGSRVTITATLADQYQNPIFDGTLVDFGEFGSVPTTNGSAATTVSSAVPGPLTVTASAGSLTEQITLNFVSATSIAYLPTILKPGDALAAADLVIETIDVSSLNPSSGEAVVLSVTIKNIGSAPTTRFWTDLYITDSPVTPTVNDLWPTMGDFGVAWLVPSLASGESVTLTNLDPNVFLDPDDCQNYSNFTPDQVGACAWPNNSHRFSAAGTYYVTALVDSFDEDSILGDGGIAESNENNNGYLNPLVITVTGVASNTNNDAADIAKQPAYSPITPGAQRPSLWGNSETK